MDLKTIEPLSQFTNFLHKYISKLQCLIQLIDTVLSAKACSSAIWDDPLPNRPQWVHVSVNMYEPDYNIVHCILELMEMFTYCTLNSEYSGVGFITINYCPQHTEW